MLTYQQGLRLNADTISATSFCGIWNCSVASWARYLSWYTLLRL